MSYSRMVQNVVDRALCQVGGTGPSKGAASSTDPGDILKRRGIQEPFVSLPGRPRDGVTSRDFGRRYFQFSNVYASVTLPPTSDPVSALNDAKAAAKKYESSMWPGGMARVEGLIFWSDDGVWSGVWSGYNSNS